MFAQITAELVNAIYLVVALFVLLMFCLCYTVYKQHQLRMKNEEDRIKLEIAQKQIEKLIEEITEIANSMRKQSELLKRENDIYQRVFDVATMR